MLLKTFVNWVILAFDISNLHPFLIEKVLYCCLFDSAQKLKAMRWYANDSKGNINMKNRFSLQIFLLFFLSCCSRFIKISDERVIWNSIMQSSINWKFLFHSASFNIYFRISMLTNISTEPISFRFYNILTICLNFFFSFLFRIEINFIAFFYLQKILNIQVELKLCLNEWWCDSLFFTWN